VSGVLTLWSNFLSSSVLGKGLSQIEEEDVPTAGPNSQNKHAAEKFKRCQNCDNTDQSLFVLDRKNGDVICENCGTVVEESLMHEGSQYRKFEGEVDRNHHGDSSNPLQSNAYNMSTTLGGVQISTGAGVGGFGSQSKNGLETVLRNAHAYTELNISNFGKGDRRTRIGYKDQQKRNAFYQMNHVGDALHLHEAVVQRAKELFAGFRDDRELLFQFKGVLAACLCEAFDELSKDGRRILKQREVAPSEIFNNPRATRRNQLHHANLAGRGGLLLDKEALSSMTKTDEPLDEMSAIVRKPISEWSVDDCRTWLMEAAKTISLVWIDERKKGAKNIPDGSQEELEGQMIEHAFTLCDKLEVDLEEEQKRAGPAGGVGRGRVNTPRLQNLGKLSIKWQHSHERGSGGKGGIGGSGQTSRTNGGGKTAGQILILKSARKLGDMINDPVAGEAIHKELQTLKSKQQTLKRQKILEEHSKQRHQQMQRKPWLQARAAQTD
jgi:transcription initiation factor TFIIIB Brf1 subunit/transcription initiation factor TFIIB